MQLPAQSFRDGGIDMIHEHSLQTGEMVDQVVKCSLLGLEVRIIACESRYLDWRVLWM
jgi:hypothetical protein